MCKISLSWSTDENIKLYLHLFCIVVILGFLMWEICQKPPGWPRGTRRFITVTTTGSIWTSSNLKTSLPLIFWKAFKFLFLPCRVGSQNFLFRALSETENNFTPVRDHRHCCLFYYLFVTCNWVVTRWQESVTLCTCKTISRSANCSFIYEWVGVHGKHVEATWKRGNHPSIYSGTQGNQEKPVSRWPVTRPSSSWLIASLPAYNRNS